MLNPFDNYPSFSQSNNEIKLEEEEEEMKEEEKKKKQCHHCSKKVYNLEKHMEESHPEFLSTPKKIDLFINNIDIIKKRLKDCEIIEANIDFSHANKNPLIYEEFLKAKKFLQDLKGDYDL